MTKKLFVFGVVAILCFSTNLYAQCTSKSGEIDGETWNIDGSPYCVEGDIVVKELEIEPGVIVEFLDDYVFQIKEITGILIAVGTAAEPIVFQKAASNTTGWQGILFENTPKGSQMTQCKISGSINSGIRIINSLPQISSCSFTDNQGMYGGGMYIVLDAVTEGLYLSGCKINTNSAAANGGGIWANLSAGSLTMSRCEINNNRTNNGDIIGSFSGGGIHLASGVAGLTLNDCKISGNLTIGRNSGSGRGATGYGGGLYIVEGNVNLAGCEISSNQARGAAYYSYAYGGGIYINAGIVRCTNSVIRGNILVGDGSRKGGGGIYNGNGTVIMENSTVAYNNNEGISNSQGIVRVTNSIVYDNAGSSISGAATVSYSDILGGHAGEGNIDEYPDFADSFLRLYPESPCVDAGNPAARYNDCVPPSHGSLTNDMGAYGGARRMQVHS